MQHQTNLQSTIWSQDRISAFWDAVANQPALKKAYFSNQCADQLVCLIRQIVPDGGRILDYGCGPGFLSRALVEAGFLTEALEFSETSCAAANALVQGELKTNWLGCSTAISIPTQLESGKYTCVLSIETYEHLPEPWIQTSLREYHRLLVSGGLLVLTTPNNEDLTDNLIVCPTCLNSFHRWGHIRSVQKRDLEASLKEAGFIINYSRAVDISTFGESEIAPKLLDCSLRSVLRWARQLVYRLTVSLVNRSPYASPLLKFAKGGRHLLVIAQKAS